MKGFKFKYESIANLIQKKEDGLKTKLSGAYSTLQNEENKLNILISKDREYLQIIKDVTSKGCKLNTLINIENYTKNLHVKITFQNNVICTINKEIQTIKHQLVEVSKEKKIMEKLKEKKLKEFNMNLKKIEEKTIDQLVTYKNSLVNR